MKGILAGMMISLGCLVFLKVGGPLGAALFSIGLLGVVTYQLNLFTGKAGFLELSQLGALEIGSILFWNVVGVYLTAESAKIMAPELVSKCFTIVSAKIGFGYLKTFIAAVGCGIMMSLAISGTKKNNFIPLLFAVPCFILSGFYHCIADAFYFFFSGCNIYEYTAVWTITVAGNWVGCNLQRLNNE